jgi:hypothetical protein
MWSAVSRALPRVMRGVYAACAAVYFLAARKLIESLIEVILDAYREAIVCSPGAVVMAFILCMNCK